MTTATIPRRIADLMTPETAGRVYSYSRFSTPEQAKGDSHRRQTEAAARWAARRGLELDSALNISDEGVSAFRGANALDGGLSLFLDSCRRGLVESGSFLLVESLDRISRMAPRRAQRLLDDIVDAGVTIVTLSDDQEYTAERLDRDPTALLIALMVSWRAHEESLTKGRRIAAAWAEKRRKVAAGEAKRLTTIGPSWLIAEGDGWREEPARSDVVRRIFALTLAGVGEHSVAKRLNGEGVPVFGRGTQWHRSTVAKMLRNPAVIGTMVPGRIDFVDGKKVRRFEQPVINAFPAVIADADWLAVRAMKDGATSAVRGRHAANGVAHIIAGLARCPACGSTMVRVNKGNPAKAGQPKLVCTKAKTGMGCPYVSVSVSAVQGAILYNWSELLANIPAGTAAVHLDTDYSRLEANIMGTEDILTDLSDSMMKHPTAAAAQRVAKIETELQSMRWELEEIDEKRRLVDKGLLRCRLDDLTELFAAPEEAGEDIDINRVNAGMKVLFSGVVVDHRSGVLRFQWRQGGETALRYSWVD
jgi:DNA invertase Pin-like site-specific DNA recombinase